LRKLLVDLKPTHIAVCFDVGKKTHRQSKFVEYKAQRQSMPDDLAAQIHASENSLPGTIFLFLNWKAMKQTMSWPPWLRKYAKADTGSGAGHRRQRHGTIGGGNVKIYSCPPGENIRA